MRVVGLDPAMANFGMVAADIVRNGNEWTVQPCDMKLTSTEGEGKARVVRKSNENLRRFREIHVELHAFLQHNRPELVFVEVPSGAQNANAAMGLGGAVGVLASINEPIIEVAPLEVKRLFTKGRTSVPKAVIIAWAYKNWPNAAWLVRAKKRTLKNEHLADALAVIVAGLKTPTFQQLMALQRAAPITSNRVRIKK